MKNDLLNEKSFLFYLASRLFLSIILIFSFNSQLLSQITVNQFKKFEVDAIIAGVSKIKKFPDGTPLGIGIYYKSNKFIFGSQFLQTRKYIYYLFESTKYYDTDLLAGLYRSFGRFEVNIMTGLGLDFRNKSEMQDANSEDQYLIIGLPIRGGINYQIGNRFSIGLVGIFNINSKNCLFGPAIDIGYRFNIKN
jgi:hypothetical protein